MTAPANVNLSRTDAHSRGSINVLSTWKMAHWKQPLWPSVPATTPWCPRDGATRYWMSLRGNEIRTVPFDHEVTAEPQDFADKRILLVAIHDGDGVDSLVDVHDDKPQVGNALQRLDPVVAQRGLAIHDPRCVRQE